MTMRIRIFIRIYLLHFFFQSMTELIVGSSGTYIDGDVLERMLRLDVIGHDRRAPVLSPIEATSLTYPALTHVTGNTVTCLVHNYPQAQHLLLPICVGAKDSSQPGYDHCGAFSQSGNFVLGVVDVADRVIVFYDSLVLSTTVDFITKNIPTVKGKRKGDWVLPSRTKFFRSSNDLITL